MHIYLFGNFHIYNDTQTELDLRPTAARLFAFLLLNRHRVHLREVVAESFWQSSEIDRARRSLNTTLWQLRNTFRQYDDSQTEVISATSEQIQINQEANLWLDVAAFEMKAKQGMDCHDGGLTKTAVEELEEAVALYQGDLLPNFYDSWVLQERERLRLIYLRCLRRLMAIHQEQRNLDTSIDYAQQILLVEPWREDVHRNLMQLYAENGRRAETLAQYRTCRQALANELDVSPTYETEALYRRLIMNEQGGHGDELTLQEATAQLKTAVQTLQDAQVTLDQAVTLVERIMQS